MDTISVIVPVYNVAPYLPACLDSLLAQSHAALEIILVDDGSNDASPALCDAYAQRDSRVKILHQPNGGVAAARNAGLAAATGAWIGWVDPDDRVEPDFFSYLLENALAHDADMAVCGVKVLQDGREQPGWLKRYDRIAVLDREQAMERYLRREMHDGCVNKLCRRRLWEGLTFPPYRMAEDLSVVWQLFDRAGRVVRLPEEKYLYLRRCDSITKAGDLATLLDDFKAVRERQEQMEPIWPQFRPLLVDRCLTSARDFRQGYLRAPAKERRRWKGEMIRLCAYCKRWLPQALTWPILGRLGRLQLRLSAVPHLWAMALEGWLQRLYDATHHTPHQTAPGLQTGLRDIDDTTA